MIRRSRDPLIFNMEIPIPGKIGLYIEMELRKQFVGASFRRKMHTLTFNFDDATAARFSIHHVGNTMLCVVKWLIWIGIDNTSSPEKMGTLL